MMRVVPGSDRIGVVPCQRVGCNVLDTLAVDVNPAAIIERLEVVGSGSDMDFLRLAISTNGI